MPEPAGPGGFFTRKLGPLPMWVWVGLGVAALYLYESRKAASSSGTDAATQALAQQGAAAAQYGYSGADLASMLSNLTGQVALLGGGNNGTTSTPTPTPGSTGTAVSQPKPSLAPSGGGYYTPGWDPKPETGQAGHTFQYIPTPSLLKQLPKGTKLFYQPAPNYFLPAPAHPISGTPLFIQVG